MQQNWLCNTLESQHTPVAQLQRNGSRRRCSAPSAVQHPDQQDAETTPQGIAYGAKLSQHVFATIA
eukprot:4429979-Amphidinium_carterae.1